MSEMRKRIYDLMQKLKDGSNKTALRPVGSVLDHYNMSAPSVQNAVDIFKGEWSSQLPGELGALQAGPLPLFENTLMKWFADLIGGVDGKRVLDLGPLEGGNTFLLERLGAKSVLGIEANSRAYLKCLIVKEALGLTRSRFLHGDFVEFLRESPERFDACIASGVLYHMANPAELIALIAKTTDRVFLWTQYYAESSSLNSASEMRVSHKSEEEFRGFRHSLYHINYDQKAMRWNGFCGGGQHFRRVMSREDILRCLDHFGLSQITIGWEDPRHKNGPAVALAAIRRQ
jgi:SAM-dependent methyltransferase